MSQKTVVITGASSGIGKALAEEFGKHGHSLLITGRRSSELEETAEQLRRQGIVVGTFVGDVSREEDNRKMAEKAMELYGRIDVLINNAGISMRALFEEVDLRVIREVMDINFYGVVYATSSCLPQIIEHRGSVIGISSIAGYRGLPARSGYCASKFAVNGFLETLRTEMIPKGVHVLTACPGFTQSNIRKHSRTKDGTAQGESPRNEQKMMSAEECAAHIYTAWSRRKKTLILTPQGKLTVFLNRFFSGAIDRLVYNTMAREADSPLK